MKKSYTRGTPQQFLEQVKNRISELESGVDSSFDYPDDLEDLENGEYESHVTEPINSSSDLDEANAVIQNADGTSAEVLEFFLTRLGWDITDTAVQNYADSVAEYIDMSRDAEGSYTVDQWYEDTKMNYPEELEEFEGVESATNTSGMMDPVMSDDDFDRDRYIHTLIGDVESDLDGEVDSCSWDEDDSNLYLTVSYLGKVLEFSIPYTDLTMEFDTIDQDSSYISNTVLHSLDNPDDYESLNEEE